MYGPEDGNGADRLDVGVEMSSCVVGDVRGPLIPTGDMLYPLCDWGYGA